MANLTELALTSVLAALVLVLPLYVKTTDAPLEPMEDSSEFDCCPRLHGNTSSPFHCPGIADARCPSALRILSRSESRKMVLTVWNPTGRLGKGENGFCTQFTQTKTGENIPMSRMRMDVTLRIGRVEAARVSAGAKIPIVPE